MRSVTIVLIASLLMLSMLAACGKTETSTTLNGTNDSEASIGMPVPGVGNVTEMIIEPGTVKETTPDDETEETPKEEEKEDTPTPVKDTNLSAPAATSGCPLISAEDVAGACNKSVVPKVTIDGLTCRFSWGEYEVNVTSIGATMGDYAAWEASIPTTQGGRFKPASAIAEYNRMKYYGWFTGKRLITATSNNLLGCTLNRLDGVIERVDVNAKVTGEVSTTDKLTSAVADTGKKTLTSVELMQLMTMKFDKTVPFEGNYSGSVQMAWVSSTYKLMITLKSMPKATYNGYLIKKSGWSVIKLGQLEETSDAHRLIHASSVDLRDHNWFVLTTMKDGKEVILSETSTT